MPQTFIGPLGTATKVEQSTLEPLVRPDQEATLTAWFLCIPSAHPLWQCYLLAVIHLRHIAGVPPAHKRFAAATHELMVIALDPEHRPNPEDRETWRWLTPINVAEQFAVNSDADAIDMGEQFARACVDGYVVVEPAGIMGARDQWRRSVTATAEHKRTGGHPGEVSH